MQRRQYEGLSLDDAINRLLAIKPVETEAEEIVEGLRRNICLQYGTLFV